jgi:hypothetical protein
VLDQPRFLIPFQSAPAWLFRLEVNDCLAADAERRRGRIAFLNRPIAQVPQAFAGAFLEMFVWSLATLTWWVTDTDNWVSFLALIVMATSGSSHSST